MVPSGNPAGNRQGLRHDTTPLRTATSKRPPGLPPVPERARAPRPGPGSHSGGGRRRGTARRAPGRGPRRSTAACYTSVHDPRALGRHPGPAAGVDLRAGRTGYPRPGSRSSLLRATSTASIPTGSTPSTWWRRWRRCSGSTRSTSASRCTGSSSVPAEGRVLLVSNHSGQLPFDGAMIEIAFLIDRDPPRAVRALMDTWVPTLPFVSTFMARCGQVVGTPENCRRLLAADEALLVFPEGTRGLNKLFRERYKLQRFGHGFMRLALESGAPVVPVAVVGAEEQAPGLLRPEAAGEAALASRPCPSPPPCCPSRSRPATTSTSASRSRSRARRTRRTSSWSARWPRWRRR